MIKQTPIIEVYSDGSGNSLDSDGGWGFRLVVDGEVKRDMGGYISKATNNIAELTAAIKGLQYADAYIQAAQLEEYHVTLVSDSQLTLGYASGRYKCKAQHLKPYYDDVRKMYDKLSADTRWVKGHSGDEHNEVCDELAKNARYNGRSNGTP